MEIKINYSFQEQCNYFSELPYQEVTRRLEKVQNSDWKNTGYQCIPEGDHYKLIAKIFLGRSWPRNIILQLSKDDDGKVLVSAKIRPGWSPACIFTVFIFIFWLFITSAFITSLITCNSTTSCYNSLEASGFGLLFIPVFYLISLIDFNLGIRRDKKFLEHLLDINRSYARRS